MIINLNDYKRGKELNILKRDVIQLISALNLTIAGYKSYSHYVPIAHLIKEMLDCTATLKIHLDKINKELKMVPREAKILEGKFDDKK